MIPRAFRAIAHRSGVALCVVVVSCSLGNSAGCANKSGGVARAGAIARLEHLAETETASLARADNPTPPDASLGLLPPGATDARAPLGEVIASWPAQADATPDQASTPDNVGDEVAGLDADHDADRDSALRYYTEARGLTARGEPSRAIRLLEQAAELDPGVAEIWRGLGDARRSAGFESSAGAAYLRAADLGIAEPEALTLAGLVSLKRDEPERAAGLFIRSLATDTPHADPLIADIAGVHLGEVLLDTGRVRAGCEMLALGLTIPGSARVRTNLGAEASSINRRRDQLLRRLGDGWCRLGEFERAADAYRDAAGLPSGSTPDIRTRRVYALRRTGRPAEAAVLLIADLRSGVILDGPSLGVLSSVASRVSPRGLLGDAIAELDDGGSATRRVNLLLARAAASTERRAERLLEAALAGDSSAITSAARQRLLSARLSRERPGRFPRLADRLLTADPMLAGAVASALLSADPDPGTLFARVADEIDNEGHRRALLAEVALLLGDKNRIADLGTAVDLSTDDPNSLARSTALAAASGRWDVVTRSIDRLTKMPVIDERAHDAALLRALESSQRFDEALVVARRHAEDDTATTDDLLRLSALALLQGEVAEAGDALDRALSLDPADERVYKVLIAFFGPNGPVPDVDRTGEIGRGLREIAPSGRLLRQLIASEMLRRGLLDESADRIDRLFTENPTDDDTLTLTLTRWRRLVATDRSDEIPLGTVREQINLHPASAGLVRLLANGLVLLERPEDAIAETVAFEARTGSNALARLAERITREDLADTETADSMTETRIGLPPYSIAESVELVSLRARSLDGEGSNDAGVGGVLAALDEIPPGSGLTDVQRNTVSNAVGLIAGHLNRIRDEADPEHAFPSGTMESALACLSWATDRAVPIAPATHDLRLTLLVETRADLGALSAAADQAIDEYPQSARAFTRRLAELLTASSRDEDAFDWFTENSFADDGAARLEILSEWFRLVIITSDASRGAELIDTLVSHDAALVAWETLRPQGGLWDTRDGGSPAELGYLMAQYANTSANPDASEVFLLLALDYDPRHPWACNDLGYGMLESGGSLVEAERLVEIAYEGLPDRANVIDSLGWVRYHRGRLEDETDPATGERIEGAITLLGNAAEALGTDDDGTVNDHLGDALYAAGRVDEAVDAWRRAVTRANNALSRLRASGRAGGVRFRDLQGLASGAAMKRNSIQLGAEPEIEPQRGVEAGPAGGPGAGSDEP